MNNIKMLPEIAAVLTLITAVLVTIQQCITSLCEIWADDEEEDEDGCNEMALMHSCMADGGELLAGHCHGGIPGVRIHHFIEGILPGYSNMEFRRHFRISRTTFGQLLERVGTVAVADIMRRVVPEETQLLIFLWYIANNETLRQVADRFDVCTATVLRINRRISKYMCSISAEFIRFPQVTGPTISSFKGIHGLPGVLGCVDGTHVRIKAPREFPDEYINRKKFLSLQCQVVMDSDLRMLDFFCGFPGSVHDARVFDASPVGQQQVEVPQLYGGECHLLGDSAYPLKRWLLTPFRDNGRLTAIQRHYNLVHSKTRVSVERGIGLWKGRFRRVKFGFDLDSLHDICSLLVATSVVYQVALASDSNEDIDDFIREGMEEVVGGQDEDGRGEDNEEDDTDFIGDTGILKRINIANSMFDRRNR